jgi:hypothetical protein
LVREVTSFLRDKYVHDDGFKSLVDNLREEHFIEVFEWVFSMMNEHGDPMGKEIPMSLIRELFDKDLVLTIKDRITAPVYKEVSEDEIVSWLGNHGFANIERLTRFPKYKNIRRFLSPLYYRYDHKFSRILYGDGNVQLKAIKMR